MAPGQWQKVVRDSRAADGGGTMGAHATVTTADQPAVGLSQKNDKYMLRVIKAKTYEIRM